MGLPTRGKKRGLPWGTRREVYLSGKQDLLPEFHRYPWSEAKGVPVPHMEAPRRQLRSRG